MIKSPAEVPAMVFFLCNQRLAQENTKSCLQLQCNLKVAKFDDISSFSVMTLDVQFLYTVPFITCPFKGAMSKPTKRFEAFYTFTSQKLQTYFMASVTAADDRIEDDHIRHQLLL